MNPTSILSSGSTSSGLARLPLLGALALTALLAAGCPLQAPVNEQALTAITLAGVSPGQNVPLGAAGQTVAFTATPTVADGAAFATTLEWSSSNPAAVTVAATNNGLSVTLTAVATGQSTITGSGGGVSVQFTVTVNIVQQIATLVVTGPDTLALGGEPVTYTVTAKDSSGNTLSSASANWSFPGSSNLFELTGASTGASVTVRAIGVGSGTIQAAQQGFSGVAPKAVHATGTSVSVAVDPATGPYLVGTSVHLAATAHGAGSSTGSAARTAWTRTGSCTVSPASGAGTTVTASAAGQCVVTATLDTTLTQVTTLTFGAAPASVTLTGAATLEASTSGAYTAVVKDAGGAVISGVAVSFSGGGNVFSFTSASGVATVTGAMIGASTLTASVGNVSSAALPITVTPSSVEWTATTKSMLAGSTAQVALRAKNASGATIAFATVPSIGKSGSDLVVTFVAAGPTVSTPVILGDGTLGLSLTTLAQPTSGSFSGTAVLYGKTTTAALGLTVTGPDTVTLAVSNDTAAVGASVAVTASASLGGSAVTGATATIVNSGDAIFSPAPTTGSTPEPINVTVSGLGKASLVATVLGVSSSPAKVVYGVPNTLALTQGATAISAATPGTAQLGQAATPVVVTVKNASNGNVAWNQGTPAHGTLLLTSSAQGVATVGTCTNPFATLSCPITPVSAGTATLTATWASADGVKTTVATATLNVSAATAPAWPATPVRDATWSGPKRYDLSFSNATSSDGAIAYTIYAAPADTTDAALYVVGNVQAATLTDSPDGQRKLASIDLAAFSSRTVIGVRAKTAHSADSAGLRLVIGTTAATGFPGAIAFLAGRTVFEATVATGVVKPLYVLGADSAKGAQPERTAPRWSKTAAGHGYVGVTVSGQAQALYGRDPASTSLVVTPDQLMVQTDGHGCAASLLTRPTAAFDAPLGPTAALTRIFTTTQSSFVSCGRATVVTTAGGGQQILLHDVEQVAQVTDTGLVTIDNGWLRAADLSTTPVQEMDIASAQLTGVTAIAAWPGPGQTSLTPHTFVGSPTALTRYDHTPVLPATAVPVYTGDWTTQGSRRLERMVAVGENLLIVETSNNGAQRMLLKIDVSGGTAQVTTLADSTLSGDDPTLGSTTAAGN